MSRNEQCDRMNFKEAGAYAVFVSYFLLIFGCFALVFRSLVGGRRLGDVFSGRAFLFIRTAFVALVATWTCEQLKIESHQS